jgi:hypothetical protein
MKLTETSQKEYKISINTLKTFSTSFTISRMQIKATWRFYDISVRMAIIHLPFQRKKHQQILARTQEEGQETVLQIW